MFSVPFIVTDSTVVHLRYVQSVQIEGEGSQMKARIRMLETHVVTLEGEQAVQFLNAFRKVKWIKPLSLNV